MYLQHRTYTHPWLQINKVRADVSLSELGLVIPYCKSSITIEVENSEGLVSPIDFELPMVGGFVDPGSSKDMAFEVIDFNIKLSNHPVSLQEMRGFSIFVDKRSTEDPESHMGLNACNYKYNVYNGYFESAYIKIKGGIV